MNSVKVVPSPLGPSWVYFRDMEGKASLNKQNGRPISGVYRVKGSGFCRFKTLTVV